MANNLPASDGFEDDPINDNSGPRWTKTGLWIPTFLWHSNLNGLDSEWGVLHNANGGATGYGENTPAYSATNLNVQGYLLRDAESEDMTVKVLFRSNLFNTTWSAMERGTHSYGAVARAQGHASTSLDTDMIFNEGIQGPTFYIFKRQNNPLGGSVDNQFNLWRVVKSGAFTESKTLLGNSTDNTYPWSSGLASHDGGKTAGLRIDVTTVAGDVDIECYIVLNDGTEVQIFDVTDTGATRVVGNSLGGFMMPGEIQGEISGDKMSWACVSCEISDGAPTVLARDEFERAQITSAATITPHTGFGSAGFCVNGKYTGDQFGGATLPNWDNRLTRGVSTTIDATSANGMHVMYDPASSPYIQARRLTFQFPAGTGSARSAGVALRASMGTAARHNDLSGAGKSGYALILTVNTAGTVWTAYLYRWTGASEIIATRVMNQSGDTPTFALGTYIDLDLQVQNVGGGNKTTGNVNLEPIFDGSKVTGWTVVSGVVELDDGSITDQASTRVLSGIGQGFFAKDDDGLNVVRISDWTQLAITDTPDTNDQASVTFDFERTGATQTLTVPVEWPVEETLIDYASAKRFEVGYTQAIPLASEQRRKWRVTSGAAKTTESAALLAFFRSIGGWDEPFFWVTDADETVTVLIDKDRLTVKKVDRQTWTFDFTMMEMVGPI